MSKTHNYHNSPPMDMTSHAFGQTGKFGRLFFWIKPWELKGKEDIFKFFKTLGESNFIFSAGGEDSTNPDIPAAYTYFGQLISHDMSFDPTSIGERRRDTSFERNYRSPSLDLDCIYGGGPFINPYFYKKEEPIFITGRRVSTSVPNIEYWDLFRNEYGTPIIADSRNDDNILVSQLHVAFQLLHNKFLKEMDNRELKTSEWFLQAREKVIRHYQWVIIHDYLPKILNAKVYKSILKNKAKDYIISCLPKWKGVVARLLTSNPLFHKVKWVKLFFQPLNPSYIPLEFSVAAFRFGHSQVAHLYTFNKDTEQRPVRPAPDDKQPDFLVDWSLFFTDSNSSHKINTTISAAFDEKVSLNGNRIKLTTLDFLRGWTYKLPSGQDIARKAGLKLLSEKEWNKLKKKFNNFPDQSIKQYFQQHTPLWYYILAEAETLEEGKRLGPVGSYIVAETIIGILHADPTSFLNIEPDWKPDKVKTGQSEEFTLKDLLEMAGVLNGAIVPSPSQPT